MKLLRFLHTADWHLRSDRPLCRKDENWIKTQFDQVLQIFLEAVNRGIDTIVHTGDIFDTPRQPSEVINIFNLAREKSKYEGKFYLLPGNHDLLYHSIKNIDQCAIGVLARCYGVQLVKESSFENVLLKHTLTFPDRKSMPPNVKAFSADELLKEFPGKRVILTGDYHQSFTYRNMAGRMVINPGCMNIQVADMRDYAPSVYVVSLGKDELDEYSVEPVEIKESKDMVSFLHLKQIEERENRIALLADKVKLSKKGMTLDFWKNVESAGQRGQLDEPVVQIIEEIRSEINEH